MEPKVRFKKEDGTEYPGLKNVTISSLYQKGKSGGTPKTTNPEYYNGNIPFLTISDITHSGKYVSHTEKNLSESGIKNSSAWLIDSNSLILSMYASYGKVCINTVPIATSQALFGMEINNSTTLNYLYQLLSYYNLTSHWHKLIQRGTQANLSKDIIESEIVSIPSDTEEQQKIADFLSNVDSIIEENQAELRNLETQKKESMKKIFSQEVRFKKNDETDYSAWEEKDLGDICDIKTGKLNANANTPNGKYRFYTCASGYSYIDNFAFDTEALLISGNGSNVGYVHYYKGQFNAYQRTYVLDNFSEYIMYIKSYLDFKLKERIDKEKHSGNIPYIVYDTLARMTISIPCIEEQQKIADFLSAFDTAIDLTRQEIEKWKETKKGIMQNLFV